MSGTNAGDAVSIEHALDNLRNLRAPPDEDIKSVPTSFSWGEHITARETSRFMYRKLTMLWYWGAYYQHSTAQIMSEHLTDAVQIEGIEVRHRFEWNTELEGQVGPVRDLFQQECMKRGLLFTGAHNLALAHCNPDVFGELMKTYEVAAKRVKSAITLCQSTGKRIEYWLEGEPSSAGFRRQS